MPTKRFVAALCTAGLLAGCGSGSKPPTKPSGNGATTATGTTSHGPAMATPGTAGKVGPGSSGRYDASNGAVLYHVRIALVRFFTSKGFAGVTVQCQGVNTTTASCDVGGTNKDNQTSSAMLTLSVDQTNGVLRIMHVSS